MDPELIDTRDMESPYDPSVKRNGEKPLTNKWLLNILKMSKRSRDETERRLDMEECRIEED